MAMAMLGLISRKQDKKDAREYRILRVGKEYEKNCQKTKAIFVVDSA